MKIAVCFIFVLVQAAYAVDFRLSLVTGSTIEADKTGIGLYDDPEPDSDPTRQFIDTSKPSRTALVLGGSAEAAFGILAVRGRFLRTQSFGEWGWTRDTAMVSAGDVPNYEYKTFTKYTDNEIGVDLLLRFGGKEFQYYFGGGGGYNLSTLTIDYMLQPGLSCNSSVCYCDDTLKGSGRTPGFRAFAGIEMHFTEMLGLGIEAGYKYAKHSVLTADEDFTIFNPSDDPNYEIPAGSTIVDRNRSQDASGGWSYWFNGPNTILDLSTVYILANFIIEL